MLSSLQITAVILAGGKARRLNGVDKGLQSLQGKPLVSHIIERLSSQVSHIYLNINRSFDAYQTHYPRYPYYKDTLPDFQGALSGILSGFQHIDSEYLLFVPCDSPFLPENLAQKLCRALQMNQVQIAYAHDGERPHPTFALIHRSVVADLTHYMDKGERRLLAFFQSQKSVAVDFSEQASAFQNFNTIDEFERVAQFPSQNHKEKTAKLLAITGYSGTGKTTLLEKLIPELEKRQIKVGLIKHSHHNVDVDTAGKDSYRLRKAGANPTIVACDQRWAMMVETPQAVSMQSLIQQMNNHSLDLIFVEGFKHENLPKIQLHRANMSKPLPEWDRFTLATATDYPLERENRLDINNINQIADFVQNYLTSS